MKKVSLFVVAVCCILSCITMASERDGDGPIVIGAVILTGELAKFGEMQNTTSLLWMKLTKPAE